MEKFDLLHDPDPATLQKLKRDPNKEAFKLKYGLKPGLPGDNDLFAIQLEAMQAPKVRAYLKRLVLKSLDGLFDENIYRQVQAEKPTAADVKGLVRSQILGLL